MAELLLACAGQFDVDDRGNRRSDESPLERLVQAAVDCRPVRRTQAVFAVPDVQRGGLQRQSQRLELPLTGAILLHAFFPRGNARFQPFGYMWYLTQVNHPTYRLPGALCTWRNIARFITQGKSVEQIPRPTRERIG